MRLRRPDPPLQFPIDRTAEKEIGYKAKPFEEKIDLSQPIDPSSSVTNVQVESPGKSPEELKRGAGFDMLRVAKTPGSIASLITIQKNKLEETQNFSDFLGELREDGQIIPEKVDDVFRRLSGGNENIERSLRAYVHQSGVLEPGKSFLQNQLIPVFGIPGDVAVKVESDLIIRRHLDDKGNVERIEFERQSRITEIVRTIPMEGGQRVEILPHNIQLFGRDGPQVASRCSIQKDGRVTLDAVDITFAAGEDKSGLEKALINTSWYKTRKFLEEISDPEVFKDKAWAKKVKESYLPIMHKNVSDKNMRELLNSLSEQLVDLAVEGKQMEKQGILLEIYRRFSECDMNNEKQVADLLKYIDSVKGTDKLDKFTEQSPKKRSNMIRAVSDFIGERSASQKLVDRVELCLNKAQAKLKQKNENEVAPPSAVFSPKK